MQSMRKPLRLIFYGDDHKEYKFLVKGGEDLRLDQRIQQLFSIMDEIFLRIPNCRRRNLRIVGYQVIPLSNW